MKEYIEQAVAIERARNELDLINKSHWSADEIVDFLKRLPTADVVEVRHARWINDCNEYFPDIKCELCGQRKPILLGNFSFNYCPNCGAKMDGGTKDEVD